MQIFIGPQQLVVEAGKVAVRLGGLVVTLLGEVEWVRVQYHPHFGLAVVGLRHELGIQQHATVPNEIVASPVIKILENFNHWKKFLV